MSLLDSIKKGLFDQEDDYEDQYIDDGPQMVNNNNGSLQNDDCHTWDSTHTSAMDASWNMLLLLSFSYPQNHQ